MKGQLAKLYLDEDVDVLLADLLMARGFDVLTTVQALQRGSTDDDQLKFSTNAQRVLISHNRVHFEQLVQGYFEVGQPHAGVIIAIRRDVYEIARRLLAMLDGVTADEMVDQLRYV